MPGQTGDIKERNERKRQWMRGVWVGEEDETGREGGMKVYRSYSKLRTHTALGPYGSSLPRSIGPA